MVLYYYPDRIRLSGIQVTSVFVENLLSIRNNQDGEHVTPSYIVTSSTILINGTWQAGVLVHLAIYNYYSVFSCPW